MEIKVEVVADVVVDAVADVVDEAVFDVSLHFSGFLQLFTSLMVFISSVLHSLISKSRY